MTAVASARSRSPVLIVPDDSKSAGRGVNSTFGPNGDDYGRGITGSAAVQEERMRSASSEGDPGSAVNTMRRWPLPSGLDQVSQSRVSSPTR